MPDAIILDLDDTIIIAAHPGRELWSQAIGQFSAELNGLSTEEVYQAIRAAADWYWGDSERFRIGRLDLTSARREVTRMAFERLERTDFELSIKIADTFSDMRAHDIFLSPGTHDILLTLRRRGLKLGMITNGAAEVQRAKIQKYDLAPYFDIITIEGEYGYGKPDEKIFRHTLNKLKVAPEKTWMAGDDLQFDIAPCRPLGIYSLWVNQDGHAPTAKDDITPDKIIRSIAEIPALL
jgi:putative hydrolase of the HAD superfamily